MVFVMFSRNMVELIVEPVRHFIEAISIFALITVALVGLSLIMFLQSSQGGAESIKAKVKLIFARVNFSILREEFIKALQVCN